MSVQDLATDLGVQAINRSKIYNKGEANHAFAFGWFVGDIGTILSDMNLSKKQIEVLSRRVKHLEKLYEAQSA